MATDSSILAWKIPWIQKPGWLQSMGSQSQTRLGDFTFFPKLILESSFYIYPLHRGFHPESWVFKYYLQDDDSQIYYHILFRLYPVASLTFGFLIIISDLTFNNMLFVSVPTPTPNMLLPVLPYLNNSTLLITGVKNFGAIPLYSHSYFVSNPSIL